MTALTDTSLLLTQCTAHTAISGYDGNVCLHFWKTCFPCDICSFNKYVACASIGPGSWRDIDLCLLSQRSDRSFIVHINATLQGEPCDSTIHDSCIKEEITKSVSEF